MPQSDGARRAVIVLIALVVSIATWQNGNGKTDEDPTGGDQEKGPFVPVTFPEDRRPVPRKEPSDASEAPKPNMTRKAPTEPARKPAQKEKPSVARPKVANTAGSTSKSRHAGVATLASALQKSTVSRIGDGLGKGAKALLSTTQSDATSSATDPASPGASSAQSNQSLFSHGSEEEEEEEDPWADLVQSDPPVIVPRLNENGTSLDPVYLRNKQTTTWIGEGADGEPYVTDEWEWHWRLTPKEVSTMTDAAKVTPLDILPLSSEVSHTDCLCLYRRATPCSQYTSRMPRRKGNPECPSPQPRSRCLCVQASKLMTHPSERSTRATLNMLFGSVLQARV